jgi:hypothetical protein
MLLFHRSTASLSMYSECGGRRASPSASPSPTGGGAAPLPSASPRSAAGACGRVAGGRGQPASGCGMHPRSQYSRWPIVELSGRTAPCQRTRILLRPRRYSAESMPRSAATDRQDTPVLSGANLPRCRPVRGTRLRSDTRPAAHARTRSYRTVGKVPGPVAAPGSGSGWRSGSGKAG